MEKQTAVEWIAEKMEKLIPPGNQIAIYIMLDQAKQMEKEQIGNSWVDGYKNYKEVLNHSRLEQYYNETFGK